MNVAVPGIATHRPLPERTGGPLSNDELLARADAPQTIARLLRAGAPELEANLVALAVLRARAAREARDA